MFKEFSDVLIPTSKLTGIEEFTFFDRYDSFKVINSYRLKINERLRILEVDTYNEYAIHSTGRSMDREVSSTCLVGSFQVNWNTSGFYLSPESITDKIVDFFINQDVDFEDQKEFSHKYRLQANNVELIRSNLPAVFMTYVSKLDYLELEVIDQRVVFCVSRSPASKIILQNTIEVGERIVNLLKK